MPALAASRPPTRSPKIEQPGPTIGTVDDALIAWLMIPEAGPMPTLEDLLRRPEWHQRAACRGVGVETFIAGRGGQYRRELCETCPVRQECLEVALADPEIVGLWGGTTERERRQMRRGRAVA